MARWKQEVRGENCWDFSCWKFLCKKPVAICFLDQPLGTSAMQIEKCVVEHLGFLKDFLEDFGLGTRSNTHQEGSKVVSSAREQNTSSQPPMMKFDLPSDV